MIDQPVCAHGRTYPFSDSYCKECTDDSNKKSYAEGFRAGQIAMRERMSEGVFVAGELYWKNLIFQIVKDAKELSIEEARDEK